MGRTLWVIRHAEREDNINRSWQKAKNPRGLKSDNSPLSKRGRKQADELAKRFADIDFDHVFASPFDRTVETATRTINNRQIPIKVEPGIAEAFYLCESPPGFEDAATLKKVYPLVDETYEPVFSHPLPKEGYGDEACIPRVKKTLETIFKKYNGDSLAFFSHGASTGAIHQILNNDWNYVGQATVSKFVEDESKPSKFRLEYTSDASHLSDKSNLRPY